MRHAAAAAEIPRLAHELGVQAVFANHDYEPAAIARDAGVFGALADEGVAFRTWKDQVIFERDEVLTQTGKPYGVFTPYKNAWLKKVDAFYLKPYPVEKYAAALEVVPAPHLHAVPSLGDIGFEKTNLSALKIPAGAGGAQALLADFLERIDDYGNTRDFPAVKGPSYLSVHLRFGTVSIRRLAAAAHQRAQAAAWRGRVAG